MRHGVFFRIIDEGCFLAMLQKRDSAAYPCLAGGNEMSDEELIAHGLDVSSQHTDFMIGTPDLSIVGTTHDGKQIEIFKNGNFCF